MEIVIVDLLIHRAILIFDFLYYSVASILILRVVLFYDDSLLGSAYYVPGR